MKCPRCQAENPPGMRFCGQCAAPLAAVCPSCGSANPPGNKFCGQCATSLDGSKGSRFSAPEAYTPKHLAERIINSKAALEGERKQVTVLFADLKGSMELLAERDPEEARKLLDPVIEHMMEAVHRYEGTVNQVMGDGIMALFGAPVAHEDHAIRACYAALRMQESVKRYAEGIFRSYGAPVEIRVGLNSGEVVVRAIGSDLHMDYTAVGQTTHLAARMEQMARPGSVLLTPETLALAEGFVQVSSRGPVPVKGLGEPIEIFELTGANPVRSRLHAAAARGLTRFVGRHAELELLRQALGRAGEGHGQVVAIVGEPGVGKSRLVWEFTHSHRSQDWLVLEAASVSYGKATTYYPVIELLRRYFEIEARDESRKVREKITGKLLSLDRALEPTLPVFLSLLDVLVDDGEWAKLDPPQRRRRTLDALKRLLVRESQGQPVLLVFEDLHWIDGETQAVLDAVVETLPTARLLLLVNYRPEYHHSWGSKTYYRQARVDPLPASSAEELLAALLGTDPSLDGLKRLLIGRTEGNPFFLEESVRTLIETNVLAGDPGAYRLTRAPDSLQIPTTAQAILAARIDRLEPDDKRLLQAASVIGKDVPLALLEAVADTPDDALRKSLAHLQAAEFLYETKLFPDSEYTFKHALTHEVTYGGLLHERRRELHARIVTAIEALHHDRPSEWIERLAHHAVRGELWEQAVAFLPQAAARAAGKGANREAAAYFEQALTALRELPEGRATVEQAIDLRLELRNTLIALLELPRALEYAREADTLVRALDDRPRLARVLTHKTHSLWMTGAHEPAIATGQEAVALAASIGDFSLIVTAEQYLGQVYRTIGDYPPAIGLFRRNIVALEGPRASERLGLHSLPSVLARIFLADCLSLIGEFEEGVLRAREALEIAEAVGHPFSIVGAYVGLTWIHLRKGDFDTVVPALERGLSLSRTWSIGPWFAHLLCELCLAYARSGRVTDTRMILDEAARSATSRMLFGTTMADLGQAAMLTGSIELATTLAERAVEESRSRKERGNLAWAMHGLGEIEMSRDPLDSDKTAGCFRYALTQAVELGMRPLVAHCHLGLGKLYRRTDKREQAREHLAIATAMYREMGMTYWLEQAEAEIAG